MDQKISRRAVWWAALTLLYLLSYWREVVFRSINDIMGGATTFYAKTTYLPFLMEYPNQQLDQLKYGLTVGFTVLFMLFTFFGIKYSIKNKLGVTLTKLIYAFCILLILLISLFALFIVQFPTFYPYLRILVGWIHSPLIFLFISIVVYSTNTLNKKVF